ncbi:MAG TPA: ribonuclease T, partial [Stenotrophomonas sp.]|nr:ribonuclease T [Stenotrophomonas sp.]
MTDDLPRSDVPAAADALPAAAQRLMATRFRGFLPV